jgi:hypothetical protein
MGKIRDKLAMLRMVTVEQQEQAILSIIKDHEDIIVDINTSQLMGGKRSDGSDMPQYSRVSVEQYGKPEGPIRLFETGEFHRGFFLETEKFPVLFNSRDSKTAMLVEGTRFKPGYGEEIFGLTKTNLQQFTLDYLKEAVAAYYRNLFLLP